MRYWKSTAAFMGCASAAIVTLAIVNAQHQDLPLVGADGAANAQAVLEWCESAYTTSDEQLRCYKDAMNQDRDGQP